MMARRFVGRGAQPQVGGFGQFKFASIAAQGTASRIGTSTTIGHLVCILEPAISIGAQCWHSASGTETLRFRIRTPAGVVLATKDISVSASGLVSITWDSEVVFTANQVVSYSVWNATNNAYTSISGLPITTIPPNGGMIGRGIYRSNSVTGSGDVNPTSTSTAFFAVDLLFKE